MKYVVLTICLLVAGIGIGMGISIFMLWYEALRLNKKSRNENRGKK